MHLLLSVLPLRILLLHLPDHEVKSLPVPVVLFLLPPPSLLVAQHLSAQFVSDLSAPLLRLLTPKETVACSRDTASGLVILGQGHAIVVIQGEARGEGALHRVVKGLSDLTALAVLQDLSVKGGFVRDHSLSSEFFSQFIFFLDRLHHIGEVLPLFKLGGTHFFEFLVRT